MDSYKKSSCSLRLHGTGLNLSVYRITSIVKMESRGELGRK